MKLFIWEGEGISSAYHDDGTLVVLAETAEDARLLVRGERQPRDQALSDYEAALADWRVHNPVPPVQQVEQTGYWKRQVREIPRPALLYDDDNPDNWDGSDEALDREPDRVIDLNTPTVVAFNGGGYD